jgi:surfeit locus 1 family protein
VAAPERSARGAARALLWPALVSGAGIAVLIGLGIWQLQRLSWKEDLIARVEAGVAAAPLPLPPAAAWAALDPGDYDYQPVAFRGEYQHDLEAHYFVNLADPNGPLGGPGYFVLTPVEVEGGGIVVVNRGFVPEARKDPTTRAEGQVDGAVTIEGLMRRPEGGARYAPSADLANNVWFRRDALAIAAAYGLPAAETAPFIVDLDATQVPGGLPQGGETRVSFPNNHLQYALTWFALAVGLAGVFWVFARRRLGGG